jgi:hypothetical protein
MRKAIALRQESAIAFLKTPKQDSTIMMTQVQKFVTVQKLPQQYLPSEDFETSTLKQSAVFSNRDLHNSML